MKNVLPVLAASLALAMAACGTAAPAPQSAALPVPTTQPLSMNQAAPASQAVSATPESSGTLNTNYDQAVSVALQLLAGTFKLEGTDLAITKDQASQLLPLWTNFETISQANMPAPRAPGQGQPNSTPQAQATDTQTQQQMDALTSQIEAAMTPAQITAIAGMKITQDTLREVMQAQGITMGGPQGGGRGPSGTPQAGGPQGNGPDNAQPPSGTPPSGGPPANRSGNGRFIPLELIKALVQYLQKTAAG